MRKKTKVAFIFILVFSIIYTDQKDKNNARIKQINTQINQNNQKINKNSYFMASFSYEVNKVTLFSIYANNAEGIAIGFDTKHDWQNIKKNFWIKN